MLDLHLRYHHSLRHRRTNDPHSQLLRLTLKLFVLPIRVAMVVKCSQEAEILSTILRAVVVSSNSSSNIMAIQLPIVPPMVLPLQVFHTTQPHPLSMAVRVLLPIIRQKVTPHHPLSRPDSGHLQVRTRIQTGPKESRVQVIYITPMHKLCNFSLLIPVLGVTREYLFKTLRLTCNRFQLDICN